MKNIDKSRNAVGFFLRSDKAQAHQTDNEEQVAMKADCCVTSPCLLSQPQCCTQTHRKDYS